MKFKPSVKPLLPLALFGALPLCAQNVEVATPHSSLVIRAVKGEAPQYLYYGNRLAAADLKTIDLTGNAIGEAYPAYGNHPANEAALSVTHADGNMTTVLEVVDVTTTVGDTATVTTIHLRDKVYPLTVDLHYKAYREVDMIETWTDIRHNEKRPVCLTEFASASLPIRVGNVHLSSLYGTWADEGRVNEEALTPGTKLITNRDGVRNSHTSHAEVMFSLDGKARENDGPVIGAALCYTGNYQLQVRTDDSDYHRFEAGIDERASSYTLQRGEVFTTPRLALTYSNEGLSGASRNFHRWGRKYQLAHGNSLRKILLNSWEGVYFNIEEAGMHQMMSDIASMGGELFVMDDGWFGDKYPRNNDSSSLGDWTVDKRKLPHGIEGLIEAAKERKIKFGIWIEPEMTNSKSELYEQHPEWVLKAAGRVPVEGRGGTQLVLDLTNPKVQDYVFSVFDNLMSRYPEIDYIKWDANMNIANHGSQYLPANRQSHLYVEWHRGLINVLNRVRAKYPDVTIQDCASGGGRANWGTLPWFDEFWVSDNTDALQRIYMQWGTSYFFPAMAMASHISASPNHTTYRQVPLKFRADVAMSARLGMEIQPKNMTDAEKDFCRKAISAYKEIRPIVQQGDLYRLVSPYDHQGQASLMYVTEAKDQAVFYWWKTEHFHNQHLARIRFAGLNPDRLYTVTELNRIDLKPLKFEGKSFTGAFLMNNGLDLPTTHNLDYNDRIGYASRILMLK